MITSWYNISRWSEIRGFTSVKVDIFDWVIPRKLKWRIPRIFLSQRIHTQKLRNPRIINSKSIIVLSSPTLFHLIIHLLPIKPIAVFIRISEQSFRQKEMELMATVMVKRSITKAEVASLNDYGPFG